MIVLVILAALGSIAWTVLVFFANMMSDAPCDGFKYGWTIVLAWAITAAFIAGWWFG